jgi:precorrin-6B methylase 2
MGPSGGKASAERSLPEREIVELLSLRPGMAVAELSSGGSRLAVKISEIVGPAGRVYAVDERRARGAGDRENVELIKAPVHATSLPDNCCDRILMVESLGGITDPAHILNEASRLLREGGRLVVVERREGGARAGFDELVCALEKHSWDIHRHGDASGAWYFLEASVSDQSVQS